MNNWKPYPLSELANFYNGMAFKPSDWKKEGIKIVRIEQINNPMSKYDYFQGIIPNENKIESGDIVFAWSATIKVIIWKNGNAVLNQHLFKVVPKGGFDLLFLYYLIDLSIPKLCENSHGSTMKHIKRSDLNTYIVKVPDSPTQKRIAKIFSTVDGQIEKTDAIIAKYQAIKQGMLHDLFTRGIDLTTGKLRPTPEQAPELYKPSPLGLIPKDWNYKTLKNITLVNQGLQIPISSRYKDYKDNRYLYITIQLLNNPTDESYT